MNYKLSKLKNQANNINNYNYAHKSNDNIIFSTNHKIKKDFYSFVPNPDVEEIPTFTFENDRNLSNYKEYINNKEALIEQNSKNYLEYMKKFERKKTPLSTPYTVFKEITQNNLNNNNYNNQNNNNIYNNEINDNINNNNNINNNKLDWNENFSNNYLHNTSNKGTKSLTTSMSANSILFGSRKSEITNPDLFYQRNNNDYYKYRAEQKKYLDYNYQILLNKDKDKFHHKQEPNVNPYNPKKEDFEHYKSDLAHNPILNPINYYSYNKYLEKEIKQNNNKNNIYNNINNYNVNKRNLSPFQQAANQIFNK